MAEAPLNVLLDQNVPLAVADWLRTQRPDWTVEHVNELGLQGKPDEYLYRWAQEKRAIIITFDEDFGDARLYALGRHEGIIRLRIWPTTVEHTEEALSRLLALLPVSEWRKSLIIIDDQKIRVRRG
jgi:predicted nuclease of predicted toxin-antitoxin system